MFYCNTVWFVRLFSPQARKLRAFWNELQSIGFRQYISETLLTLQPCSKERSGWLSFADVHLQPPVTLWSIQLHFSSAELSSSALLPCSALPRQVCRTAEPIPCFLPRQAWPQPS